MTGHLNLNGVAIWAMNSDCNSVGVMMNAGTLAVETFWIRNYTYSQTCTIQMNSRGCMLLAWGWILPQNYITVASYSSGLSISETQCMIIHRAHCCCASFEELLPRCAEWESKMLYMWWNQLWLPWKHWHSFTGTLELGNFSYHI